MPDRLLLVSSDGRLAQLARELGLEVVRHVAGAGVSELEGLSVALVDLAAPDGAATARDLVKLELPVVAVADGEEQLRSAPAPLAGVVMRPLDERALGAAVRTAVRAHRVRSEQHARAAWLQAALGSTTEAIIGADASSRVMFLNAAAEELTGWTEAEARGRMLDEVLNFDGGGAVPDGRLSAPVTLTSRSGGTRLIEHNASPIIESSGTLAGVVAVFRDVTGRKSLEQRLTVADRMSSIGTLAAGVAHELNNPLSFVTSNLEYAVSELSRLAAGATGELRDDLEEVRSSLRDAAAGAQRAADIIKDMKTFTRAAEVQHAAAPVDVNQICSFAARITGNAIKHKAELVLDLHADGTVLADDGLLRQVFVHLLTNAAQAIDASSEKRVITLSSWSDSGTTSVRVADTGCGIAPENLQRIFEPFFTTKPVGEGTGLGLSLCHSIVTGLGGHMLVESKVGVGTSVTVVMPRGAVVERAVKEAGRPALAPPRVLVIDDETLIGTAIRRILTKQGMEVVVVERGREGVDLVTGGEHFDAIFCDMMMPEFSGVDVYDALRAKAPSMMSRVIFMTGNAFAAREHDLFSATKNVRVEKPFLPADLSGAVAEVLRRHAS
ncbi:MAG: response regulator [Deltaproteobacteria bacterium]|nr:response regulator [Deltaproteobacteria bacterium]